MIFLFPKKKIVLDCFTSKPYVMEHAPINYAIKNIPDWWRNLPASYRDGHNPVLTMKSCAGMIDYYTKSISIPLWSDLSISVDANKNYTWQFSDEATSAIVHPKNQFVGFLNTYGHIKIDSPWLLKSEKNLNWVWSHPTYNYSNSNNIVSLPGITNFYHQHTTNINMLINLDQEKNFLLPYGEPLVVLTPMSDRKVKIVRHLVSENEYFNLYKKTSSITFVNKYKSIVDNKFGSCPYSGKLK
jgi:hypothetical protein